MPSYKEWFWLVVLEANAFWVVSIWYDVPWLRDSIKNWINWFKVSDWDYKAMWEKIYEVIKDNKNFEKLANSSFNHIKNLETWEQKVKSLEKFILKNKK